MEQNQKIHVIFAEQAIRNHLAMQAVKKANNEEGYNPLFLSGEYILEEFNETEKIMIERSGIDTTQFGSLTIDLNACKKNKNDYIFLQTRVVHTLGSLLDVQGRMPETFDLEQFNTNKIVIGKYRPLAGLFMQGDNRKVYKEAMSHMREEISSAHRQVTLLKTVYFGMK